MDNGCKFSADKESSIAINYFREKTILSFQDKGIGIVSEELPYIFKPFHRGSNKGYADGHGIGLSLTEKIIAIHQGTISVLSQVNKGTSFVVDLPHF